MYERPSSAHLTDEDIAIRARRPHAIKAAMRDATDEAYATAHTADASLDGGVAFNVRESVLLCVGTPDAMQPWSVY